jgi:hypothetical protein
MLKRTDDDRLSSPDTAKGKLQRVVLDLLREHEHDGVRVLQLRTCKEAI